MICRTPSRRRRAMTLVEVAISSAIFLIVGLTVAYLVVVSARASHDARELLRTEAHARLVMSNIRKEAMVGEFLSVQVKDSGKTVEFYDPVTKTTADLRLVNGALIFRQDKTGDVTRRFDGVSDVSFNLIENQAMLEFQVTTTASDSSRRVRPITLRERIFFRNFPAT